MSRLKQAMRWATKYRAVRYMLYGRIYFVQVPLYYVLALLFGWVAAVIEETREATEALVNEYRILAHILQKEREAAKHLRKEREHG